jgi:ligand-binding sensor domain-containing protein/signal transduction histidine kinase
MQTKYHTRIILLWLLIFSSGGSLMGNAQPFLRKISFLEGLPSPTIYDMYSSKKGFIYLGTNKGLVKFNGAEFAKIPMAGKHARPVNNVCENEQKTIWCKNFSNQVFYVDYDTLCIHEVLQNYLTSAGNLREMIMVKNTLWLMTQFEVFTFNTLSEKIESKFKLDKSNSDNSFLDIHFEPKESVIYVLDVLHVYKQKNDKLEVVYSTNQQQSSLMSYKGDVYVTTKKNEKSCINLTKKRKIKFSADLDHAYFNYLRHTDNQLWLCTNKGVLLVDVADNENSVLLLKEKRISDVVKDFQGNVWISTLDEGLFLMPNAQLKTYSHDKNKSEHMHLLPIVEGPEATFFVGSSLGQIFWYSVSGQLIQSFDTGLNNEIEFLYYDSTYNRLMHTFGYIDLRTQRLENTIDFGKCVFPDDQDNYIVCTFAMSGLIPRDFGQEVKFSQTNTGFRTDKFSQKGIDLLIFRLVRARCAIFSSIHQKYYIAFSDGVWAFDKMGVAQPIVNKGEPILANSMKLDNKGNVWLATLHQGLLVIDNVSVVNSYTIESGLSNNDCKHVALTNSFAYVVHENGIDRIHLSDNSICSITQDLALNQLEMNDIIVLGEHLWVTTNTGLLSLPANHTSVFQKPLLYASRVWINELNVANLHELAHYQNNVKINFEVVNFNTLGQHEFKYRLIGYDTNWQYQSGTIESVNYLSLPPGTYTFQIQALSLDIASELVEIDFSIHPPFWMRWWFISLEILAGISLLWWVYHLAERRTRARQLLKEKLALSQLTALRSQMNPHFLFNVLNSVQGLIYANKKNDATEYLGKFSDLMRKTLEIANKKFISLAEEIELLKIYLELEAGRFEEAFEYTISIDASIDDEEIKIPTMIVQPFVENAVKHGLMHKKGVKTLVVRCTKPATYPAHILIEVEDNGIGRAAATELNKLRKKHNSFATKAIDTRINLLNQSLSEHIIIEWIDKLAPNRLPQGTLVSIYIPLNL